ncbi:uncharacterized protein K02A2.6-like [Pecten maximus]|uniref:uncharacterized protein K02A2.6-like n=1 Tax=Pecten maximus TaxID=6579 RepID=UPI0014580298|nr:uncharacterized protein K02A2.6-like [Pecten maximus]
MQGNDEPFEQFMTDIQIKVKDCQYTNGMREEMVRDRIVIGIRNPKIREKLINIGSDLTLAKAIDVTFEVVRGNVKAILGAQTCSKMGLVQRKQPSQVNEIRETSIPDDIKHDYGDIFKGLGCMPGTHTIKTDSTVTPVVDAPRKVPFALKDRIKKELDRMEQESAIVKQEDPTQCVNSMMTVVKPSGKIRICIDPKNLNSAILREHFPMKTVEDVIANMPQAKVFTKLDATPGFWQLKLDEESSKLCTFNSPFGRYSFRRLPFGIKSAPEVYQRAISEMVNDLEGCDAIVDDLLIWGENIEQHDEQESSPLRKLLVKDTEWIWEKEQEDSFQRLKQLVTEAPVLRYYDPFKEITLTVDASSTGLGAALIQDGQPIAYASRALTETQQRYAQIEKETLTIVFGCTKYHQFIFGREVTIEWDHKPLQAIFRKPLNRAPPRLQRLLLTLQKYTLNVVYKPGKTMYLADALSRSYLKETRENLVPDIDIEVNQIVSYLPISSEKYQEFKRGTSKDEVLSQLREIIINGWQENKHEIRETAHHYWPFRDELSCIDGLLFKSHTIIVPKTLRREMLKTIHSSHLGIVKCKLRARELLYWPGMSSEIEDTVSKCSTCATNSRKNPKEPLLMTENPNRPWSVISADIFQFQGHKYLVTIGHYSKWPELSKLDNMSNKNTMLYLKSQMSRYGIPDKLITDNGPQFANEEFKKFSKTYGFEHTTSSPRYPQANGQAERTVQTVTNILKKSEDPYKGLLAYRNTVIEDLGLSPAQMFFGRRLKTDIPTTAP